MAAFFRAEFTVAADTGLAAYTPDVGAALAKTSWSGAGSGQVDDVGDWVRSIHASSGHYTTSTAPSNADYTVRFTHRVVSAGAFFGPYAMARVDASTQTCYALGLENGSWRLLKYLGSTSASTVGSLHAGHNTAGVDYAVEWTIASNVHTVKIDGTTVIGPVADNSILTAGLVGLFTFGNPGTAAGYRMSRLEFEHVPVAGYTTPTVAGGGTGATVTASPPANMGTPTLYQFQRAPDVGGVAGTYVDLGVGNAIPSYSDTGLTVGVAYHYRHSVSDGVDTAVGTGVRMLAIAPTVVEFTVDLPHVFGSTRLDATHDLDKLVDNNPATNWTALAATDGYFGYDAGPGNTVTPSSVILMEAPGSYGPNADIRLYQNTFYQGDAPAGTYGSSLGRHMVYTPAAYWRRWALPGAPAAARTLKVVNPTYNSICGGFRLEGTPAVGSPAYAPCQPRFSTAGPKIAASTPVTITTPTTGASIGYTTDGTTPAFSAGAVVGTTVLYTGPVTVSPGTTLKAVAHLQNASTPTSAVMSTAYVAQAYITETGVARASPRSTRPEQIYDDQNVPVRAHTGGMLWDSATGLYYWFGTHFQAGYTNGSTGGRLTPCGINVYTSTDLYNWTYRGVVLDPKTQDLSATIDYIGRMHPMYNPSATAGREYTLWMHANNAVGGYGVSKAASYYASSPLGPWTLNHFAQPNGFASRDCTVFYDGTAAWFVSVVGSSQQKAHKLSATDWSALEGTVVSNSTSGNYEGIAIWIGLTGQFVEIDQVGNFYVGPDFDEQVRSAATLAALATATRQDLWSPSTPANGAIAASQVSASFRPQGRAGRILILDWYDGIGTDINPNTNYDLQYARTCWIPIPDTAYVSGKPVLDGTMTTWALTDIPASPAGPGGTGLVGGGLVGGSPLVSFGGLVA